MSTTDDFPSTTPAIDKFPEEMLDDIRKRASKAYCALHDLLDAIDNLREKYPSYGAGSVTLWWRRITAVMLRHVHTLKDDAEELADAEDETAEGGEE